MNEVVILFLLRCREPEAEEKFKEISNAYEVKLQMIELSWPLCIPIHNWSSVIEILLQVLSDDEKRSIYDRYGEAGLKGSGIGMGVSYV